MIYRYICCVNLFNPVDLHHYSNKHMANYPYNQPHDSRHPSSFSDSTFTTSTKTHAAISTKIKINQHLDYQNTELTILRLYSSLSAHPEYQSCLQNYRCSVAIFTQCLQRHSKYMGHLLRYKELTLTYIVNHKKRGNSHQHYDSHFVIRQFFF